MRALALNEIGVVSGGLMWGDEPMDEVTITGTRSGTTIFMDGIPLGLVGGFANWLAKIYTAAETASLVWDELNENEQKLAERDFTTAFDPEQVVRTEIVENFFGEQMYIHYYADGTYWIDANQNGIFESHFSDGSGVRMLDSDNNGTFETPMTRTDWMRGY